MENFSEEQTDNVNSIPIEKPTYPPKYQKQIVAKNLLTKSLSSLILYLIIGYFLFQSYQILLLITIIVMIHEMGHFLAMKIFKYSDVGIFFIPL